MSVPARTGGLRHVRRAAIVGGSVFAPARPGYAASYGYAAGYAERCTFCGIAAGHIPAEVVHDWGTGIAIKPLDPVNDGHVLVIPRRHVATFAEDPVGTGASAINAAQYAAEVGDCNVIVNVGRAAGQSVFHLHWHILPRTPGDGLVMPWSHQERTSCGHPRSLHGPLGCGGVGFDGGGTGGGTGFVRCPCRYAANDMHHDPC